MVSLVIHLNPQESAFTFIIDKMILLFLKAVSNVEILNPIRPDFKEGFHAPPLVNTLEIDLVKIPAGNRARTLHMEVKRSSDRAKHVSCSFKRLGTGPPHSGHYKRLPFVSDQFTTWYLPSVIRKNELNRIVGHHWFLGLLD